MARKLTQSDVDLIRKAAREGMSQGQIARSFGITSTYVGRIVRLECWQTPETERLRERLIDAYAPPVTADQEREAAESEARFLERTGLGKLNSLAKLQSDVEELGKSKE